MMLVGALAGVWTEMPAANLVLSSRRDLFRDHTSAARRGHTPGNALSPSSSHFDDDLTIGRTIGIRDRVTTTPHARAARPLRRALRAIVACRSRIVAPLARDGRGTYTSQTISPSINRRPDPDNDGDGAARTTVLTERVFRLFLLLTCAHMALATQGSGQSTAARVSGTVYDEQHGVLRTPSSW